ncbi:hypothetical protein ACH40F_29265 [Streptomyces sp. NPDC020794]|uniref:hypothetical protein n=1 Tax=unclassified Streptomyces TaxID=2593676 RepID=UPI0036E4E87C
MYEPKTRQDYLATASRHLAKAVQLAGAAESAAYNPDHRRKTADYAAAGALHADVARSAAAIAQAMPETEQDAPEDTDV